jgi:hypothetical protein
MKHKFKDYAHDTYSEEETVEMLVDVYGWDEHDAYKYTASHAPMYEVQAEFEYDTETDTLTVLSAIIDGTVLRP